MENSRIIAKEFFNKKKQNKPENLWTSLKLILF